MIQHSADFLRIGSKHDSTEPLSNLRAMRIYRTIAVHSSSTPTIDDVLNSKEDFSDTRCDLSQATCDLQSSL